jgi:phosphatidylserine/phosphatidylglycerophosphate/cardiolipin synthase-like enzyme
LKLIVQPADATDPVINAIKRARKSIEIVIFRFDQAEVEKALVQAAERGVFVHALIAFTNRGGEKNLRKLEMRLLAKGITVARTAGDLVRYHGKMMLVDRKELLVLAYNFTRLDTERSRSFGILTRNRELVQEAAKLFEADTKRQPYKPGSANFIVSPENARQRLAVFLKGARTELLIYDPKISDQEMIRLLEERLKAGVKIKIIGQITHTNDLRSRNLGNLRLHARVFVRDRKHAFVGSQSLRKLELDGRREIGVIIGSAKIVRPLIAVFGKDWKSSSFSGERPEPRRERADEIKTKKVAKAVSKKVSVAPVIEKVTKEISRTAGVKLDHKEVKETVQNEIKTALKKAVKRAATEVVENAGR